MAAETTKTQNQFFGLRPTFLAMQLEHLEEVLEIEHKCFPTPWTSRAFRFEVTENDFALYLVALINGRVMGYGGMWLVLDEAHITNVAVHPQYRSCGNGRALMVELLTRAAVLGAIKMTLEVRVTNKTARNLYKSLGFIDMGIRRKYYSDNDEDGIIMCLDMKKQKNSRKEI
ncbi:MAG: ribosomal protein S18-alanine N-acetyltransferase [Desulfocucumaceae bacterium]